MDTQTTSTECDKSGFIQMSQNDANVDEIDGPNCKEVTQAQKDGVFSQKPAGAGALTIVDSGNRIESNASNMTFVKSHTDYVPDVQLISRPEVSHEQIANGLLSTGASEPEELSINSYWSELNLDKSKTNKNIKNTLEDSCGKETVPNGSIPTNKSSENMENENESSQLVLEAADTSGRSPGKSVVVLTESDMSDVPFLPVSESDVQIMNIKPKQTSSESTSNGQTCTLPPTSQDLIGSHINAPSSSENLDKSISETMGDLNPNNDDVNDNSLTDNQNQPGVATNCALTNEKASDNSTEEVREKITEVSDNASESEGLSKKDCHPEFGPDKKSSTNENVETALAGIGGKETYPDGCVSMQKSAENMETESEASQLNIETANKTGRSPVKSTVVITESDVSAVSILPVSEQDVKTEPEQTSPETANDGQTCNLPLTSQNLDKSTSEMSEGLNLNNNGNDNPLANGENNRGLTINGILTNEKATDDSTEKVREENMEASNNLGLPVMMEVSIKQEPPDEDYHRVEQLHRGRPLVVYSSGSDADTSSGGSSLPPLKERLVEVEETVDDEEAENKKGKNNQIPAKTKLRTEGEVFPEELPPLEYLTISPDESVQLEPIGVISGIVDILVVVKANDNSPALYDDTILFVEGRKPLGLIFETFGTVEKPYYSVRFNKASDITEHGLKVGQKVFYAPKADNLTKYVFIAELRKIKCDDASWKDDNEVPAAHRDYSDDEEERREKRRAQNKDRGQNNENGEEVVNKRKKKRRPQQDNPPDPAQPRLLPGELNRNPFGTCGQRYRAPKSNPWPPSSGTNGFSPRGPEHRPPSFRPPVPSNPRPRGYQRVPTQPPTSFSFGENPRWPPESRQQPHSVVTASSHTLSGPSPFAFTGQPGLVNSPGQTNQSTPSPMPFSTRVPPPNFSSFGHRATPSPLQRYNSPINSFTPSQPDHRPSSSHAASPPSPVHHVRSEPPPAGGSNSNVYSGQPLWPPMSSPPFRPPASHTGMANPPTYAGTGNPSSQAGFANPSPHTNIRNPLTFAGVGNQSQQASMSNPSPYTGIGNPSWQTGIGNPSLQTGFGNPSSHAFTANPLPYAGIGNPSSHAFTTKPPTHAGMGNPSTFNPSLPPPQSFAFSTSQPPSVPGFNPYQPPPPCKLSYPPHLQSSRWTDNNPN